MSNLGPLTTTYSASGPNCNSIFQTNGNALIYGTTSGGKSSGLPTGFIPYDGYYYSPGVCPLGSSYACYAGFGDSGTAATCCPPQFTCNLGRASTDAAACISLVATDSSFTISQFVNDNSTTRSAKVTAFLSAGNHIYANGVVVRRSGNDPTWPTTASTTNIQGASLSSPTQTGASNNTDPDTSTLSTGAKVGIGVGAAVGAFVIIGTCVAAYLIGKRKRQAARTEATPQVTEHFPHAGGHGVWNGDTRLQEVPPVELEEQRRHAELEEQRRHAELEEQRRHAELEEQRIYAPVELMGS